MTTNASSAQVTLSLQVPLGKLIQQTFSVVDLTWDFAQNWCRENEPHCFIEKLEWRFKVSSCRVLQNSTDLEIWIRGFMDAVDEDGACAIRTLHVQLLKQAPRPEPSQIRLAFIATQISSETNMEKFARLAKGLFDEVVLATRTHESADVRIVLCHRVAADGECVYIAFTSNADDGRADITAQEAALASLGVHAGFFQRSQHCDITLITELINRNVKVVLCGHSLGGAVAGVRTLQLSLAMESCRERLLDGSLRCIGFGVPFFASKLAAEYVHENSRIRNLFTFLVADGDPVPSLLASEKAVVDFVKNGGVKSPNTKFARAKQFIRAVWTKVGFTAAKVEPLYVPLGNFIVLKTPVPEFDSDVAVKYVNGFAASAQALTRHTIDNYKGQLDRLSYFSIDAMFDGAKNPIPTPAYLPPAEEQKVEVTIVDGAEMSKIALSNVPIFPYRVLMREAGATSPPVDLLLTDENRDDLTLRLPSAMFAFTETASHEVGDAQTKVTKAVSGVSLANCFTQTVRFRVPTTVAAQLRIIDAHCLMTEGSNSIAVGADRKRQDTARSPNIGRYTSPLAHGFVQFTLGSILSTEPKDRRAVRQQLSPILTTLRRMGELAGLSSDFEETMALVEAAQGNEAAAAALECISKLAKAFTVQVSHRINARLRLETEGLSTRTEVTGGLILTAVVIGGLVVCVAFPSAASHIAAGATSIDGTAGLLTNSVVKTAEAAADATPMITPGIVAAGTTAGIGEAGAANSVLSKVTLAQETEPYLANLKLAGKLLDPSADFSGDLCCVEKTLCGLKERIESCKYEGRVLTKESQGKLENLIQFAELMNPLRKAAIGLRGVCCFGKKDVGKSTALNHLFGLSLRRGYNRKDATLTPTYVKKGEMMIIDFPGWGDVYAAKAASDFVNVGAVVRLALVVVNAVSHDANDAAVMRSVKDAFDPESIVVVLNRADTSSGTADVKYAVDADFPGISLIDNAIDFFRENSQVVLHRCNMIVTAFTDNEPDPIEHSEYVPKQLAIQKIKAMLMPSNPNACQVDRWTRKRGRAAITGDAEAELDGSGIGAEDD
jgi:hypothetical protein